MAKVSCGADFSCPYQYYCDTANNECLHEPVFPLSGYPIAIYCLFPFASALCNTTGNSFGQFKVIFLMIALNYSEADATILSYPMVAGTALYNFFLLMFRRHPTKNTTLVDYNIVMIIIPSVLFGSTVGTILNDILPPVVANVLITILLAMFSIKFFCKLRSLIQEDEEKERKEAESMEEIKQDKTGKDKIQPVAQIQLITKYHPEASRNMEPQSTFKIDSEQINPIISSLELNSKDDPKKTQKKKQDSPKTDKSNAKTSSSQSKKSDKSQDRVVAKKTDGQNRFQQELDQKIAYEESCHFPHILAVLVIFAIFAVLALLAQGKLVKFSNCSQYYVIGMVVLTMIYALSLVAMKKYINNRMQYYRTIGYDYEYPLDTWKYYGIICLGAFFGGFNAGLFSKGNSTTIIFTLVYLGIEPIVASAIVGFQVVFSAAVSLTQAYSKGQISGQDIGFYLGLTFIGGGILSHIVSSIVKRMNKDKVNKILVGIIGSLTCMSAISLLVNLGISYKMFGSDYMNNPGEFCQA